jgi:pimeloyl-ACP methyl ester carboxylesterase
MRPLLVLHDTFDPLAGSRWRALCDAWPGPALAPDLPGHGEAPPPVGGNYAPSDATLVAVRVLRDAGIDEPPVVVGHGWGGFAAELLSAAGRTCALVLVDGLGDAWLEPAALVEQQRAWLRALADDLDAQATPVTSPDPRLRHRYPSIWERSFTEARRAAIGVPVLALETLASPTPAGEREARLRVFASGATAACRDVDAASSEAVRAAMSEAGFWG